jgi:hypothetical protein
MDVKLFDGWNRGFFPFEQVEWRQNLFCDGSSFVTSSLESFFIAPPIPLAEFLP